MNLKQVIESMHKDVTNILTASTDSKVEVHIIIRDENGVNPMITHKLDAKTFKRILQHAYEKLDGKSQSRL